MNWQSLTESDGQVQRTLILLTIGSTCWILHLFKAGGAISNRVSQHAIIVRTDRHVLALSLRAAGQALGNFGYRVISNARKGDEKK